MYVTSKRKAGPFVLTETRFPGIRLVEQTEQIRRILGCLKEKIRVTVIVGLFYYKKEYNQRSKKKKKLYENESADKNK